MNCVYFKKTLVKTAGYIRTEYFKIDSEHTLCSQWNELLLVVVVVVVVVVVLLQLNHYFNFY